MGDTQKPSKADSGLPGQRGPQFACRLLRPSAADAAAALDRACFGPAGLWSRDSYAADAASPRAHFVGIYLLSAAARGPARSGGGVDRRAIAPATAEGTAADWMGDPPCAAAAAPGGEFGGGGGGGGGLTDGDDPESLVALGCLSHVLDEGTVTVLAVRPEWRRAGTPRAPPALLPSSSPLLHLSGASFSPPPTCFAR